MSIEMNRPKEIVADILAKGVKIENIVFVGCGASMAESIRAGIFWNPARKSCGSSTIPPANLTGIRRHGWVIPRW